MLEYYFSKKIQDISGWILEITKNPFIKKTYNSNPTKEEQKKEGIESYNAIQRKDTQSQIVWGVARR